MGESSSCSFSCSCSSSSLKYDVFLSFRGKDTRNKFMSHLHGALGRKNMLTFTDYKLIRGCEISSSLLKAIEESKISVVIFSKDYASSSWCLDELVKVIECKEKYGQIVVPIFYEVEPSDVRNQTGAFGDAFAKLGSQKNSNIVQRWKDALTKAANLAGWVSNFNGIEYNFTIEIAEDIWKKLNDMPSSGKEYLVGLEPRIEEIESLLSIGLNGVYMLGIWGMSGIGKTTLARAVFEKISYQFEGSYFITNVMEELQAYQKSDWLQLNMFSTGLLCNKKKLLFVLDDVTQSREIELLIGLYDSLGSGSRIILTSRDKHVFYTIGVDCIYTVEALFQDEAVELFSWYAFGQNYLTVDYMKRFSKDIVKYAKGFPLILKILGSSLHHKCEYEWRTTLNKLRKSFNWDIFDVLKVIYDGLSDEEKKIFLDIACIFTGEHKDFVETFLKTKGFSTIGITTLMNKSLIHVSKNKIEMHDLIQQLGWKIAQQEYFNRVPGKSSFWWHHKDIYLVLRKDEKGTVSIAGLSLDISKIRDMHLYPCSSKQMPILEFCFPDAEKNNKVHAFQCLESTFTELRFFHLHGYPTKSSLLNFRRESLFVFDMPHNNFERLWNANQMANFQLVEKSRPTKKYKLNPTIEMFSKLVDRCVKQKITIEVDHEEDIYGNKSLTIITPEDCHIMISMAALSVDCMDVYIRMLYEQLKEDDMLGQFAFINPAYVSLAGAPNNARRGERARAIASCLQRATQTQLIFMPCNPAGLHWVLVVIDMPSMTIYYLDSSVRGSADSILMNIMHIGLTIYYSHKGNQSDQVDVQWKSVKVPLQSRDAECGYYVMRFMKDIVADMSLLTDDFHGKETYTQEEIDEVRCEWTTFVSRYI